MKKAILILFMFLVSLHIAFAAVSTSKMFFAMDCENTTLDSTGKHNGTNTGVTFKDDKVGRACSFDGSTSGIAMGDADDFSFGNDSTSSLKLRRPFTISFWINASTYTPTADTYLLEKFAATPDREYLLYLRGSNTFNTIWYGLDGIFIRTHPSGADSLVGNTSHFFMMSYNASDSDGKSSFWYCIDGVNYPNGIDTGDDAAYKGEPNGTSNLDIGTFDGGSPFYKGTLDRIYTWGVQYNQSECSQLYNAGNGLAYPFVATININSNTYNVTSAYANGTIWRTSQNGTVRTYDETPTVTFLLDTAGNCSISKNPLNYTAMIADDANTLCATTSSTSQSCTLPSSQNLTQNSQYVYIACKGTNGADTTSGGLSISLDPVDIDSNTYNVSNANVNGTAWRTSANQTVFMRNRNPIVRFDTFIEANCSLSKYQFNYTAMLANDSTTDCGDNLNISHICTLSTNMPLVNGAQFLYIGCKTHNAESRSATSPGLNISMDRRIVVHVVIQNGSGNSSYAGADVFAVMQSSNATADKGHVNSTGDVELFVQQATDYLIYGYDKTNSSVEGDIKNHVVVN